MLSRICRILFFSLRDHFRNQNLHLHTKYRQNRVIRDRCINKWRLSTVLTIFKISKFGYMLSVAVQFCFILPIFVLIGQLGPQIWQKYDFQNGVYATSWNCEILIFGRMTIIEINIRISKQNFIKIGWIVAEIYRYDHLRNGARPSSWIFETHSCDPCLYAILLHGSIFGIDRSI